MPSRFFVPPEQIHNNQFTLLGSEARHAALVLRKKAGDIIDLFDGKDLSYQGRIESIFPDRVKGVILKHEKSSVGHVELVLFQALIKGPKWDWLVEKACEIGVSRLVPLVTERTVVRLTPEGQKAKIDRWQRMALAASKQCGRSDVMKVADAMDLQTALQNQGKAALSLFPWEKEEGTSVCEACADSKAERVNIFIGPEGGWEASEVSLAIKEGARPVTLGPTLLRAETAGMTAAILAFREFGVYA